VTTDVTSCHVVRSVGRSFAFGSAPFVTFRQYAELQLLSADGLHRIIILSDNSCSSLPVSLLIIVM